MTGDAGRSAATARVRELTALLITRDFTDEQAAAVSELLGPAIASLKDLPEKVDRHALLQPDRTVNWDPVRSPFVGSGNPLAAPVHLEPQPDGSLVGSVTWGDAYEGPPGCVHGGMLAGAFDEVLGDAQPDPGGMTARLEIDFRSPSPLHRPLTIRTRLEREDGRKRWMTGTLHDGDRLLVEARGLFVRSRPV